MKAVPSPQVSENCHRVGIILHLSGTVAKRSRAALVVFLALAALSIGSEFNSVQAQSKAKAKSKSKIAITSPSAPNGTPIFATGNSIFLEFTVSDEAITLVKVRTTTKGGDAGLILVKTAAGNTKYSTHVPLFKGRNTIELFAVRGDTPDETPSGTLIAGCNDPKCFTLLPAVIVENAPTGGAVSSTARNVIIARPAGGETSTNKPTIERAIKVVKSSGIKNLAINITNEAGDKTVQIIKAVEDLTETEGFVKVSLKLSPGKNTIRAYSLETLGEKANQDVIEVTLNCTDATKCPKAEVAETTADGETGKKDSNITILQPTDGFKVTDQTSVDSYVTVLTKSGISKVQFETRHDGKTESAGDPVQVTFPAGKSEVIISREVKIFKGNNTIRVFDADHPENIKNETTAVVVCEGPKCATGLDAISIKQPGKESIFEDKPLIDSRIVVQKSSEIANLRIRVTNNEGQDVDQPYLTGKPIPLTFEAEKTSTELISQLRVLPGRNTITVYDAANSATQASVVVTCRGDRCGMLEVAGSQNYRAIAGFEQAGASSATSQTKPFIDFFFNTPLWFRGKTTPANLEPVERGPLETLEAFRIRRKVADELRKRDAAVPDQIPFLSSWGQVRLSTTPEQTSAVGAFPSNLINQVSQNRTTVDLVQSFDFMAGLELRLFNANGKYTSLGTNPRRAHFFLVGGAGAISPLTNKQQSIEIFNVPTSGVQRDLFISRFGPDAANKKYIAFVLPERDRFLRQYYAGLRVKTFDCATEACTSYQDRFPAIFQFMVGQNEAVTGGKFKNDVTDSNGKILGQRNSFIFRVDGTFPLSIRGAGFYLYGTAMLKFGGGGVRITTPLFMDHADGSIQVTSPDVFVAPNLQLNRDYYKIGVGFDLMKLFKP